MVALTSSTDYSNTFLARDKEVEEYCNVMSVHQRVRSFFEALKEHGCYHLDIGADGETLSPDMDGVDVVFQRYLNSPNRQAYWLDKSRDYMREGKIIR